MPYQMVFHQATRDVTVKEAHSPAYLIDLIHYKNNESWKVCNNTLYLEEHGEELGEKNLEGKVLLAELSVTKWKKSSDEQEWAALVWWRGDDGRCRKQKFFKHTDLFYSSDGLSAPEETTSPHFFNDYYLQNWGVVGQHSFPSK